MILIGVLKVSGQRANETIIRRVPIPRAANSKAFSESPKRMLAVLNSASNSPVTKFEN
jgi:hypothetical protein